MNMTIEKIHIKKVLAFVKTGIEEIISICGVGYVFFALVSLYLLQSGAILGTDHSDLEWTTPNYGPPLLLVPALGLFVKLAYNLPLMIIEIIRGKPMPPETPTP